MITNPTSNQQEVIANIMARINETWVQKKPEEMRAFIHPEIVMVFPGFAGSSRGADAFIAGFKDMADNVEVEKFDESDQHTDVTGDSAVVSYRFEMIYSRSGNRYRATGRDLWIFSRTGEKWLATWRTMLEMNEEEIS